MELEAAENNPVCGRQWELRPGGSSRGGEKCSDSGYVSQVKPTDLTDVLEGRQG
jgi:hypothetical protein